MADLILLKSARLRLERRKRTSFFSRKNTSFTAVDLDGSLLRVVQATQRKGAGHIVRFATKELRFPDGANSSDPAVAGPVLAAALKELRVPSSHIVMGLPRAVVLLRSLIFPVPENTGELASMVNFQFGKDLPFPAEEAVIDFHLQPISATPKIDPSLPRPPAPPPVEADDAAKTPAPAPAPPAEKIEVLAAAVRKELIEQSQSIAKAAQLDLVGLGMLSYANARALQACQIARTGESLALVSLRPDEANIDVLTDGSLIFSRTATIKIKDPAAESPSDPPAQPKPEEPPASPPPSDPALSPEEVFARAVTIEVVRSLHSYEGMGREHPIRKLVVVGTTGFENATVQALQIRLNLPSTLLEPAAAFGLKNADPQHASGALGVIGLALSAADSRGLPFDFLNPKRPPVPRDTRKIKLGAGIAALLLILISFFGIRQHYLHQRLQKKAGLEQQLATEQKHQNLYRLTRLRARTIEDWLKDNQPWLDHYAYLSIILPPNTELYVSSITTSPRGALQLSVQARTGETLAGLDKILRSAGYDVKPLAITPTIDKAGYPFKSTLELWVPPGKKIDFDKILAPSTATNAFETASVPPQKPPRSRRPASAIKRKSP